MPFDPRKCRFFKGEDVREVFALGEYQENCTEKDDSIAIIYVRELVNDAEANDVERIGRNECQRICIQIFCLTKAVSLESCIGL
jgi:hypothetical protein